MNAKQLIGFLESLTDKKVKLKEDSAGKFQLLRDVTIKDTKGREVKLKKGMWIKHERQGGFGADYFIAGGFIIDGDLIPSDVLSSPV